MYGVLQLIVEPNYVKNDYQQLHTQLTYPFYQHNEQLCNPPKHTTKAKCEKPISFVYSLQYIVAFNVHVLNVVP